MVSTNVSKNEFWKCIWYIILAVTYGKKGYKLWESTTRKKLGGEVGEIKRDIRWKTYLLKVSFTLYNFYYSFLCH